MAEKLSAKTELATRPAKDDYTYIVDFSDKTDAATGTSKRIQNQNLFDGLPKIVVGYQGYVVIPGPTSTDNYQVQAGDILIGKGAFSGGNMIMAVANTDDPALDADLDLYLNNSILP